MVGEALGPEAAPVVGNGLIKCSDDVVKRVGLHGWASAWAAVEKVAEIVDRFLALALLTNNDIDPQPVERAFIVEIGTTAPRVPLLRREIKLGSGVGGVLQVAPGSARNAIERGCGEREVVAILVGGKQAAARCEHPAEIIGQSFIDPEQISLHGLLIVGRGEVSGTTELSIPGMDIFVRQQSG